MNETVSHQNENCRAQWASLPHTRTRDEDLYQTIWPPNELDIQFVELVDHLNDAVGDSDRVECHPHELPGQ